MMVEMIAWKLLTNHKGMNIFQTNECDENHYARPRNDAEREGKGVS